MTWMDWALKIILVGMLVALFLSLVSLRRWHEALEDYDLALEDYRIFLDDENTSADWYQHTQMFIEGGDMVPYEICLKVDGCPDVLFVGSYEVDGNVEHTVDRFLKNIRKNGYTVIVNSWKER